MSIHPSPSRWPLRHRLGQPALSVSIIVSLALCCTPGGAYAHTGREDALTALGPATNAVFPVGPFHASFRGAPKLTHNGKPELLVVGAINDGVPGVERWSLVKALSQFGSFSGLSMIETGGEGNGNDDPTLRVYTYDWRRAVYRSNYIAFVHYDDLSGSPTRYFHLPRDGQRLTRKSWHLCLNCSGQEMQVGNYYRIAVNISTGDFLGPGPDFNTLPFTTIQDVIRKGYAPPHYSQLAFDVDAETNAMTALICHADGKKPASVCGRSVIKKLMKHLK